MDSEKLKEPAEDMLITDMPNTDVLPATKVEEPAISTKPANFQLNEILYIKGIRFKITYFNQGRKRMTLEHYPYSKSEIKQLTEKAKNEN